MVALAENLTVANRFRLNRLIGRGGMGSVWHATHLGLDVPCAVKFIEGEAASLPEAHARFEREAKAAAQLRSPHVVQILDHGVWEGRPYIAMELLDGEDLKSRIQKAGRLNPNEIGTIITQVCRALTKAHGLGIVHRDLKPDNIFLVRDDDREIAKVLDFGIAKRNDSLENGGGSNTRTGAMLGTPYYMSPEQAQGVKTVDSRSDLWSLAVIVYQALLGELPFQSEALGDLLVKIIVQPLPVPSKVGPVPPQFDAWWAKATQRDPSLRFQSAKEFADSLMLAIGASQVTDVMDGRALRAQLQQSSGQLPFGSTPQPGVNPQFAMTPPQSAMAHSVMADTGSGAHRGPQFGGTVPFAPAASGSNPHPGGPMAQSSGGFAAHGSTGAPFTTTSSGVMGAPPKKSNGALIGVIVGMVVLAGVIVVGTIKATAPKAPPPVAASSATASAPIAKTNDVPPPTTAAVATATTPSATAAPSDTASAAPTATTAANTDHSSSSSGHSSSSNGSSSHSHGQQGTGTASSATTAKTGSKSGADVDKMGF